ncbi:hypothetical protein Gotri_027936, partial [Gossypium trilobum]|nr:hypothetical protein [Gossypium trilobum]
KNYLSWSSVRAELVISDPELVKKVLRNSENFFPKRKLSDIGEKLLGNGLAFIEGEKWAKHRKLADKAFHGERLKNMTPTIIASVETMLEKWKAQESKEIESEKLEKGIQDCVMEIIKKTENKVVSGEADSFGDDYLGLLVNAYHDLNDKNKLSLEDLVGECKTIYFAGQSTLGSLLSWIVLHLAIHGDWQEKARREVIDIFGNQNPLLEGITKLKTMFMIINGTLRLYGPINGLPREVAREVQLGKLVLPANIDILVLNSGLHRDPYLWGDDVNLFKPERFSERIAKATNYNATGSGPRSCVGMTFAMIETKVVLSMILQRYTVTLSPMSTLQYLLFPLYHNMEFK